MTTKTLNTKKYERNRNHQYWKSCIWMANHVNADTHKNKKVRIMLREHYDQGNFDGYSRKKCDHLEKRWVKYMSQVDPSAFRLPGLYTVDPKYIGKRNWTNLELSDYHYLGK